MIKRNVVMRGSLRWLLDVLMRRRLGRSLLYVLLLLIKLMRWIKITHIMLLIVMLIVVVVVLIRMQLMHHLLIMTPRLWLRLRMLLGKLNLHHRPWIMIRRTRGVIQRRLLMLLITRVWGRIMRL